MITTSIVRRVAVAAVATVFALCPGCVENGLSVREKPGLDFSRYTMSLYQVPPDDAAAPRTPLMLPARIAVAQIGEVAPPQDMLATLRDPATFSLVQAIPATPDLVDGMRRVRPGEWRDAQDQAARDQTTRMLRYSRDIGADYLFLFGGTIDHATTGTGLSLADVTIVGAFTVPSKRISAEGRANGVLIDARSGRIVLAVGASHADHRMTPTAASETDELKVLSGIRDELTKQLAEQLKSRAREVASAANPT